MKLGARSSTVAARLGLPQRRRHGAWRYCVRGGGKFIVVFSKHKRARLIVTTARHHHRGRRVHPGMRTRTLRRLYRHRGLHHASRHVLRAGPFVFGLRRKRVRYVGVASRALRRSNRVLLRYNRRAGFRR